MSTTVGLDGVRPDVLTEASLTGNRVVRADDTRSVHANSRKHGISDIENLDGLPVTQAGSIINCAHSGYREGQNKWGQQLFLPQSFAALFLRKSENGGWSSWKKALTSTDDQVGNLDDFNEFMSVVNKNQANKPGGQNGLLLSMPYFVYRPDYKWGCQIYITEVTQEMYFRCKNANVWGPWKKVVTDAGRVGEKAILSLMLHSPEGVTFQSNSNLAKFIGYRQPNGDYSGFVQVDATINFAPNANWQGITLVSLPDGWQLVESHQACGDLFQTGTNGHFWRLWSECDEPGSTTLIKSWNNNSDIPRNTPLRLMYNFPCIIKYAATPEGPFELND
jgi:hypothetical protein